MDKTRTVGFETGSRRDDRLAKAATFLIQTKSDGRLRFNPCAFSYRGRNWMVYRVQSAPTDGRLALCEMTANWVPLPETERLLDLAFINGDLTHGMHEDPRVFFHGGRPYLSYILSSNRAWYLCCVVLVPLDENLMPQNPLVPDFGVNRAAYNRAQQFIEPGNQRLPQVEWRVEKNWQFFEWNGKLHCIYSINPHRVVEFNQTTGKSVEIYQTFPALNWAWGRLSGGASPVKVGAEYFSFFHSWTVWENPPQKRTWTQRIYHVGVYAFEAQPPFRITRISKIPILSGDISAELASEGHAVVFPGGAIYESGQWTISLGWNDNACKLLTLDHGSVLDGMVSVRDRGLSGRIVHISAKLVAGFKRAVRKLLGRGSG